jgi:hypothetical protein
MASYPIYHSVDRSALQNFYNCFSRVKRGLAPCVQWSQTRRGYVAFLRELGPKPNDGQKWTVGRKNHDRGYVKGNIEWQTLPENIRQKPFSKKQSDWAREFAIKRNKAKKWTNLEREVHAVRMKRWHRERSHQLQLQTT